MTHSIASQSAVRNIATFTHGYSEVQVSAHRFQDDTGKVDRLVLVNDAEISIEDVPALINALLAARDEVA